MLDAKSHIFTRRPGEDKCSNGFDKNSFAARWRGHPVPAANDHLLLPSRHAYLH
jgi:hypothetical protein